MMTQSESAEYLAQLGITVPDPLLTAIINKTASIDACMDANGYSADSKALVAYYLTGLLAISSGGRRVSSQSAPSGASQSYKYGTLAEQSRQLRNALALVDPAGCASPLVPASSGPSAALYVVPGSRHE